VDDWVKFGAASLIFRVMTAPPGRVRSGDSRLPLLSFDCRLRRRGPTMKFQGPSGLRAHHIRAAGPDANPLVGPAAQQNVSLGRCMGREGVAFALAGRSRNETEGPDPLRVGRHNGRRRHPSPDAPLSSPQHGLRTVCAAGAAGRLFEAEQLSEGVSHATRLSRLGREQHGRRDHGQHNQRVGDHGACPDIAASAGTSTSTAATTGTSLAWPRARGHRPTPPRPRPVRR